MSEEPETKMPDPEEEIKITRKNFQVELQKAHNKGFEIGSSEKYRTLGEMLFDIVKVYAKRIKPQEATFEAFLKFVVYALERQYLDEFEKQEEQDEKKDDGEPQPKAEESQEAPEGGHEDVHEGESGRQEAVEESKEKEEVKS